MTPSRTPSARRSSRARPAVAALLLLLVAAALVPAAANAEPMYWGGTIKGHVYGLEGEAPTNPKVLQRFQADTGKKITMVNTGQSWAAFDAATMNAAIAAGEIPLVTMRLENVTLKEVREGRQDAAIENWARAAKAFGYPFLFRPWWEVNGTWYSWGRSPEYVAAWQHFHDVVERVGATNVTWDWVVDAVWNAESNPEPWFPGNEYVDWVGMDAYNWGENPVQPASWLNAEESIQPTLEILERLAPGKPVCICESASTAYDEAGMPPHPAKKAAWIHEMLDTYLPSHPSIKAYLWFNWDDTKSGDTSGRRYDWPIESSPESEAAFREGIAAPDYISRLPVLTKLAKVPMPTIVPETPESTEAGSTVTSTTSPSGSTTATPAPPTTPTGAASPGGGLVAVGAPRLQQSAGTAKLPFWVPGAGDLQITARGARIAVLPLGGPARTQISRHVPGRERFTLEVRAAGANLRELSTDGTTRVTVLVRFTPSGGTLSQKRLTLTLHAQT